MQIMEESKVLESTHESVNLTHDDILNGILFEILFFIFHISIYIQSSKGMLPMEQT